MIIYSAPNNSLLSTERTFLNTYLFNLDFGDVVAGEVTAAIRNDGWTADITIASSSDGLLTGDVFNFGTAGSTSTSNLYFNVVSEGYNSTGVLGTVSRVVYATAVVKVPDGSYGIMGCNSASSTFTAGETITQTGTGATAIVYTSGQDATHKQLTVYSLTGSPNSSGVWTGGSSGCTMTPTAAPVAKTTDVRDINGHLVVRVSLSEYIFNDDKNGGAGTSGTNPKLYAVAGFWSKGASSSLAASNVDTTNNSLKDYPPAIGQWDVYAGQFHRTRAKSDFIVSCNAFHGFGVACVRFNSVGGTSAVDQEEYVTFETPTKRTTTNLYAWAHQRTVTLSAYTQGETITSRFRIYPNIGDADSICDTSGLTTNDDVIKCKHEHIVYCDKNNSLDVIKYVHPTGNNASDGSLATPWQTIDKGITTTGVNTVKLLGTGTFSLGSAATRKTTNEWVTVEPYSNTTPIINFTTTKPYRCERVLFKNVEVRRDAASWADGENLNHIGFIQCNFNRNGVAVSTAGPNYQALTAYFINCSGDLSNTNWTVGFFSTSRTIGVYDGCILGDNSNTSIQNWYRAVACYSTGVRSQMLSRQATAPPGTIPLQNNTLFAYNKIWGLDGTSGGERCLQMGGATGIAHSGLVIHGNILHKTGGAASPCVQIAADGATGIFLNTIVSNNTFLESASLGRSNLFYNDTNLRYDHADIYVYNNDFGQPNIKTDDFAHAPSAIGNWPQLYGCGWRNNVHQLSIGFDWMYPGVGTTTGIATSYAATGSLNYEPAAGATVLDRVNQSSILWKVTGDQNGQYLSTSATGTAAIGAVQPSPSAVITYGGTLTANGGSYSMPAGSQTLNIRATGLVGATLRINDLIFTGVTATDPSPITLTSYSHAPTTDISTTLDVGAAQVSADYGAARTFFTFNLTGTSSDIVGGGGNGRYRLSVMNTVLSVMKLLSKG